MCRPFYLLGGLYGDAGVGISRLSGLCVAFLFASSLVDAATINVGPSDYRNYGPSATHTGSGIQSTFGQNVRLPPTVSGPTRILPVSRNPVIPYGSVANGLRNFTRINPVSIAASAAVTGIFLFMDYAFDPESGSWGYHDDGQQLTDPNYGAWESSPAGFSGPSAEVACNLVLESFYGPGNYTVNVVNPNFAQCQRQGSTPATVTRVLDCPAGYEYIPAGGYCEALEGEFIVLGEQQFADIQQQLPLMPPQTVADAASDIQRRIGDPLPGYQDMTMTGPSSVSGPSTTSTSTDPVTGDTVVTNTSTQTNISYGDTTITTTNTTTSTSYQNGQETSTTVTTETPGELPVSSGGAAGDWPGFCDWASVVCDWLNWTQEEPPPEQDLPQVVDDDFYEEKNISFGSKSCPPDHEINLTPFLPTSVAVSFQPLCDFAGLIYYMVMAASYIIAAYISIGVARNA